MKILQSGRFAVAITKITSAGKGAFRWRDQNAKRETPDAGGLKIGDLSGVRIDKFKVNLNRMLLAYQYDKEAVTLTLLAYGSHENFYRDLKKLI